MEQRKDFTHFNVEGRARMVDVGPKGITRCTATADYAALCGEMLERMEG